MDGWKERKVRKGGREGWMEGERLELSGTVERKEKRWKEECKQEKKERKEERKKGRKEGTKEGRKEGRMERRKEGRMEGRKEGRIDRRTEGRTDRQTDRRTDRQTEGRKEGRKEGRNESENVREAGKEKKGNWKLLLTWSSCFTDLQCGMRGVKLLHTFPVLKDFDSGATRKRKIHGQHTFASTVADLKSGRDWVHVETTSNL